MSPQIQPIVNLLLTLATIIGTGAILGIVMAYSFGKLGMSEGGFSEV